MRPRIQKGLSLVTSLAMVMTMCTGFTSISWASEASGDDGSQVVENAAGGGSSQADDVSQGDDAQVGVKANDFSVQSTWEGSGTQASPYLIKTAADLELLSSNVKNGSTYSGMYFKLEADIDLSTSTTFERIGTSTSKYFKGDFDGQNHTVTLAINEESSEVGLFGVAGGGAVIHDVTIAGSVTAKYNVAGLVGKAMANLTVKNCTNSANISSGVATSSYNGTGGLIGVSTAGQLTVDGCKNTGTVTTYDTGETGVGGIAFGGVVGGVWASSSISSEVKITNCTNTGNVVKAPSYKGVGGVIGRCTAYATIESCVNRGEVSAVGTSTSWSGGGVGGIAGYVKGFSSSKTASVYRCSNENALTGPNSSYAVVGGVVGQLADYSAVTECFNKGAVSTTSTSGGYAGGVVGYTNVSSSITKSYNAAAVNNAATSTSNVGYAGGVVGYAYYSTNWKGEVAATTVKSCYSYGTVSCAANAGYVGGVIGSLSKATAPGATYVSGNSYLSSSANKGIGNLEYDADGYKYFEGDGNYDSLLTVIGTSAYQKDLANPNQKNNGYPILRWQNPDATYQAAFVVKDAETGRSLDTATVTLKNDQGSLVTGSENAFELNSGTYTYMVECAGYTSVSDESLNMGKSSKEIAVHLTSVKHPYTLKVSPATAQVKITSEGGAPSTSCETGDPTVDQATDTATYTLNLADNAAYGAYNAEVKLYNYVTQSSVSLEATADNQSKTITLSPAQKHALNLNVTPSDAKVYITNTDWNKESTATVENGGDRTYQLIDGDYSYKVKASGYKTYSGTFTMNGADQTLDAVTLEEKKTWDGKSIDIDWYTRNPDADSFDISEPEELAGLAALVNAYDPTTGAAPIQGQSSIDFSGKTINLTKDIDLGGKNARSEDSWTGWTAIGAYKVAGTSVNKYFKGVFNGNGHEIKNLYVNGTGEGNAYANGALFGQTDGATISNLKLTSASIALSYSSTGNVGALVGYAKRSIISSVEVSGDITLGDSTKYVGGIAGAFSGKMKDCINRINIQAGYLAGGLVGGTKDNNGSEILRCANYGAIVGQKSGSTQSYATGGIVGQLYKANDVVKHCVNYGSISGNNPTMGGIVGCNNGSCAQTIESCYNLGAVGSAYSTPKGIGGIIGYVYYGSSSSNTAISKCYNGASLSGEKNVGGVAGFLAGSTSTKGATIYNTTYSNRYLSSSADTGANDINGALNENKEAFASFETSEVNAEFISGMGNAYGPYVDGLDGCEANKTNGVNWPILRWQNPDSKFEASFTFTYDDNGNNRGTDDPVVKIFDKNDPLNKTWTASVDADGKAARVDLPNGTYTYAVTVKDYAQATGEFTIDKDANVEEVELKANHCAYTIATPRTKGDHFSLSLVKVTDDGNKEIKPSESRDLPDTDNITSSEYVYSLLNGTYKYTAKRFGYETLTGTFEVKGETTNKLNLSQTQLATGTVNATVTAESGEFATNEPTIEIYAKGGDFDGQLVMSCNANSSIFSSGMKLYVGTYTYKIKANGYTTIEDEFELTAGGSVAINKQLKVKTGWGGAGDCDTDWYVYHNDDSEYTLTNVSELAGLAKLVNDGTTNFESKTIKLACDMDLTDNAWTPIGDMSKQFKGTFDGLNHVVSMNNGKIEFRDSVNLGSASAFSGLFGSISSATVKNVVLQGSASVNYVAGDNVSLVSAYVGALAGHAISSTVKNCSNQMKLVVNLKNDNGNVSTNLGGLVGWSVNSSYSSCSNVGNVQSIAMGSAYNCAVNVGGIAGYQNVTSACSATNCYNTADITVTVKTGTQTASAYAGGIFGSLNNRNSTYFEMFNCYNAGNATASAFNYYGSESQATGTQAANALIGSGTFGTFANNYYLDNGLDNGLANTTKKIESEMKTADFVSALNNGGSAYIANPNGGYPILEWEKAVDHIKVTTQPNKLAYNDLEDFDDTGMKLTAYYGTDDSNGSEVISGWSITGGKKMAANTTKVTVSYKGAKVDLPITVTAVDHVIASDDLSFDITAPQAGATPQSSLVLTDDQNSKLQSASISWTCGGKAFDGNFEAGKFYRAHVALTSNYTMNVLQWVFANGAWPSVSSAYEVLNYTQSTNADSKLTSTEFDVTFAPVGYTGSVEPKMFYGYYEGDTGTGRAYDLSSSKLKVTVGNKAASNVDVAGIEASILKGDIDTQKLTVDGTKYVGIDLLDLLEANGVARTVADDTSITFSNDNASGIGDVTMTYGDIRQMPSDSAAIVAFASVSDSMPLGTGTGPLMLASTNGTRTCLSSITVDEPATVATQKLTFNVDTNDDTTLDASKLDITIRDGYGHKIVVDTKDGNTELSVRDGDTYSYRVTYGGYNVVTGSVKVNGKARTVKITLNPVWDGTTTTKPSTASDGYIEIGTAAELMWWHDNYKETDKVRLTADIALNDGENNTNVWDVLGTNSGYGSGGTLSFSGVFDGNGHVIRNILIQRENTYELELSNLGAVMAFADRVSEIGFFGYTSSATIKNLGLEGTIDVFDRPDSSLADWLQIGGIVGLAQGKTTITGCYTNMAIRAVASTQTDTVGGYPLAGYGYVTDIYMGGIAGSLSATSTISDCYTKGTYIGAETRQVTIGGIVGGLRYDTNKVTNCYSTATIDARPLSTSTWKSWLGGIVGVNYNNTAAAVKNSYALNSSIVGNGVYMKAGKVIGRAAEDALSGNYALDTMTISGADKYSETGATTVNGASITMSTATSGKAYDNWSTDTWKFTSDDEGALPMLSWQKAQAGDANIISYDGQDSTAVDDEWDGYFGSQSAPPYFKIYARVGNQSVVIKKFTRDEMKTMAAADNTGTLYYSSVSSSGYGGRAVKEYVTIETLLKAADVEWVEGDSIIMGNYRYDLKELTAERYYYPDWTSGSSEGAIAVKPVIALKSNGAKSGMSKELLPMYAQQADYLYAYMLTFGQSDPTESSYGYFIYQQTQMGVYFKPASVASVTLTNYLSDLIAQAEADRDATYVSVDGSDVAGSAYYVSQEDKDTFNAAINTAKEALAKEGASNEDAMNAITALNSAQTKFNKTKKQGRGVNRTVLSSVVEKATSVAYNAKVSADGTDISTAYTWATQDAVNTLKAAINDACGVYYNQATTQAQINEAARVLQAALSSFKVDKGTKEVAYRNAKVQELTSYANGIVQGNLTSYQQQKVQEALSTYVAKIKAALSIDSIDDAFNTGKAAIDAAAVAKQDSGGGSGTTTDITKAKADAKAALQAVVDGSGLTGTDKEAVQKIADEYASKIEAATDEAGVNSALSEGKSAISKKIDEIKLAAAKADAKAQLAAYAKEKGAGYADQDALQKAVDTASTLIDTASSTADVTAQLNAGKAAIDALVAGGSGQEDELEIAKANAKAELASLLDNAKIDEDALAAVRDIMIDYTISIEAATSINDVNELLVKGRSAMESYIDFATSGTTTVVKSNMSYKLYYKSDKARLIKLTGKAKTAKTIKIPATVSYCGTKYKVTSIASKACAKQIKATKLTIGSNVKTIKAKAFAGCKKLTVVTVSSKKLTKASIKNLIKSTKVKTIKVKVSKKASVNKKYVSKYGKWAKSYNGKVKVK